MLPFEHRPLVAAHRAKFVRVASAMDVASDGIDEVSELRRLCAALKAENTSLKALLAGSSSRELPVVPAVWAAFAAEVRPEDVLTPAEVMECGKLFCQYLDEVNGLHIRLDHSNNSLREGSEQTMGVFGGGEEAVCAFARYNLGADWDNILVQGDLELLLERAARKLEFPLSHSIMREPQWVRGSFGHCSASADALSFAMLTHPRLGANSAFNALPSELVRRIVESALARLWGIFRDDVHYKDFLDLVARHVKAARSGEPNTPRDWILARCNTCNKWRRVPGGVELEVGEDNAVLFQCESVNRICHQAENTDEDKDERYWRRRWWKKHSVRDYLKPDSEWKEEEEEERGVLVAKAQEPERIRKLLERMISRAHPNTLTLQVCIDHVKALFDGGEAVCAEHEALIASTFEAFRTECTARKIIVRGFFKGGDPDSVPRDLLELATRVTHSSNANPGAAAISRRIPAVARELMPVLLGCEMARQLLRKSEEDEEEDEEDEEKEEEEEGKQEADILNTLAARICKDYIRASFDSGEEVCIEHKALIDTTTCELIQEATRILQVRNTGAARRVVRTALPLETLISNEAIRRLMRRAGVVRWSTLVNAEFREILSDHLDTLVYASLCHAEHRRSLTVLSSDIAMAVQQHPGRRLYLSTQCWPAETDFSKPDVVSRWTLHENDHQTPGSFISIDRQLRPHGLYGESTGDFLGSVPYWHPLRTALQEICEAQRSCDLMIRSRPFRRLVEQIAQKYLVYHPSTTGIDYTYTGIEYTFDPCALHALQEATEDYIVKLMEDALLCSPRFVLFPKFIQMARRVRGERS